MVATRSNEIEMTHMCFYRTKCNLHFYYRVFRLFYSKPCICSQALCVFLVAVLHRLGEECYHIWRVILINENLFVTHRGYARLITKDQNKGGSQVSAKKEEQ